MMKKYFLFIALFFPLFLCSCGGDDPTPKPKEPEKGKVNTRKVLTGTFVEFFDKDNWEQSQWNNLLDEMKQIGFNTVIVQFAAFNDKVWYDGNNAFTPNKGKFALERLLAAAEQKQMDVYIGLYFDNSYWQNQTNENWLRLHAERCITVAEQVNALFGHSPAFKGWYIPHEPEPNAYNTDEKVASFRNLFVNKISNRLHQINNKPVSIAAFWNSDLTSPQQLQHFMAELSKANLQVIMLQDGVGVGHVKMNKLADYYKAAAKGLYTENTAYQGEFWTDLETFTVSELPASIERIKQQLTLELGVDKVSKAVSFQYYKNMCPTGPYGREAGKLRQAYFNYVKSLQ